MHHMLVGIGVNGASPSARLRSLEWTNRRVSGPTVSHYFNLILIIFVINQKGNAKPNLLIRQHWNDVFGLHRLGNIDWRLKNKLKV